MTRNALTAGLMLAVLAGCTTTTPTGGAPPAPQAEVVFTTDREIEIALPPGGTMQDARDAARPFCSPLRGRLSPGRTLTTGNVLFRCDPL